ncbi:MAG: hypothetical protein JWO30_4389 [Fibrobacteres bacterium]|nr:hypothetical protein [Fibrobacterota bacterium]
MKKTKPVKTHPILFPFALPILLTLAGCERHESATGCDLVANFNYCFSIDGNMDIPDSLRIVRTDSRGQKYSLPNQENFGPPGNCMPETQGRTSIQVYRDTTLLKEIDDIFIRTVDGCHGADTLIDIRL